MNQKKIISHIQQWLSIYNDKAGTNGFVVGVSGGIDSAVTSTLGAMTGLPMLCLEMDIHQHPSQVNRGLEHIDWLKSKYQNVSSLSVNLTEANDTFIRAQSINPSATNYNLTCANTRARLRMSTLYFHAGIHSALVLGTGNKVEDFGVGFYTKYGDGGVDLSPIADLNKTKVFELAKELGIVNSIQTAAPTDGLFGDDRTDEDQLGASYPELEWAMSFDLDSRLELTERQQEVLAIYQRLNKANQHKMKPIPVCEIPPSLK